MPARSLRDWRNSARSSNGLLKRINRFYIHGNIGNLAEGRLQFGRQHGVLSEPRFGARAVAGRFLLEQLLGQGCNGRGIFSTATAYFPVAASWVMAPCSDK